MDSAAKPTYRTQLSSFYGGTSTFMSNFKKKRNDRAKAGYRPLVIAALVSSGILYPTLQPAFATSPKAGTSITNEATASYTDDGGQALTSKSNVVTLTVAEIAGITVKAKGITNNTGGSAPIKTGDKLFFDFEITNDGNDPTQFFIPGKPAQILGGTQSGQIQIISSKGAPPFTTPIDVPASGGDTKTLLGSAADGSFAPGQSLIVRVAIDVTADTSGAPIRVLLGDTGANDNSATTQNQAYSVSTNTPAITGNYDIYTQDNADIDGITDEQNGNPANGDTTNHRQEASAFNETYLQSTPKAFATILKTAGVGAPVTGSAPNVDLPYSLSLRVEGASPDSQYTAADLQGTQLTVDTVVRDNQILVSDVIPANTTLTAAPTAPANWTVVYSNDDPTASNNSALEVDWSTTAPTTPAEFQAVKRVGFIYNANAASVATDPGNGPIAKGTTVSTFKFTVRTNVPSAGGEVLNIAQVFGQTISGTTQNLVYDESGDQNPNNYNGSTAGTNSNVTPATFNALNSDISEGVPNKTTQGTDTDPSGNPANNQGSGDDGEVNVVTIGGVTTAASILVGPNGKPAAIGPSSNNDDFTNLATKYGTGADANNPLEVTFNNTIKNTSVSSLTNVLVRPLAPATATDLPVGTLVTITVGGNTATYEYKLNATTSVYSFDLTSGTPIEIPTILADTNLPIVTKVDLPDGTLLSTADSVLRGYGVPIVAFTDNDGSGTYNTGDTGNITIDRVYVGFLKLLKEAQILDSNGNALTDYFTTISTADQQYVKSGNTIQYRVSYINISEAVVGTDNSILTAKSVLITEDGLAGSNTWFNTTVDPKASSGAPGSATTTTTGALSAVFATNTSGENDIQTYTLGTLDAAPAGPVSSSLTATGYTGNLIFKRAIK
ncbi:beta strand repeat-containing protein [Altericista sp. CCNU0014]|uniref:beta strand repeat-containing protein n=1 Tax=Altericista sp. CCNU0014 TaxID=3082949 RepID=UPI00384C64F3